MIATQARLAKVRAKMRATKALEMKIRANLKKCRQEANERAQKEARERLEFKRPEDYKNLRKEERMALKYAYYENLRKERERTYWEQYEVQQVEHATRMEQKEKYLAEERAAMMERSRLNVLREVKWREDNPSITAMFDALRIFQRERKVNEEKERKAKEKISSQRDRSSANRSSGTGGGALSFNGLSSLLSSRMPSYSYERMSSNAYFMEDPSKYRYDLIHYAQKARAKKERYHTRPPKHVNRNRGRPPPKQGNRRQLYGAPNRKR